MRNSIPGSPVAVVVGNEAENHADCEAHYGQELENIPNLGEKVFQFGEK